MPDVQQIIDKNKESMIIPDGIVVISKDKQIIVFNEAASRITGYDEEKVIGNSYEILFDKNHGDKNFITDSVENNLAYNNISINIIDAKSQTKMFWLQ